MLNRRVTFIGVSLLACAWLTAHLTAPLWAQPKEGADLADEKSDKAKESALDVSYAKAYAKLMEATLARYAEINRAQPGTIRANVMQSLEEDVRDAQERVKHAEGDRVNISAIYVTKAEADLRIAEENLRKSEAARARSANAVSLGEIERLRAALNFSRINVEKAQHLASESPLSNVRYEMEQLREDVQELRLLVSLLRTRN